MIPATKITPETLTTAQIAEVERHARETKNKRLLLACQRAADTSRHNLGALRQIATWLNERTAFVNGLRSTMPR